MHTFAKIIEYITSPGDTSNMCYRIHSTRYDIRTSYMTIWYKINQFSLIGRFLVLPSPAFCGKSIFQPKGGFLVGKSAVTNTNTNGVRNRNTTQYQYRPMPILTNTNIPIAISQYRIGIVTSLVQVDLVDTYSYQTLDYIHRNMYVK